MRVIAGEHKGRRLFPPKGDTTRPTTDRVREALMSSLGSIRGGLDGAVVLDTFAGSGALGVECISRGAAFALFCDRDPHALDALRRNTEFLDRTRYRVARLDVAKHTPPAANRPYDLVFFDPPYATDPQVVADIIAGLIRSDRLDPQAIIVYEHDETCDPATHAGLLALELAPISHKHYGDIRVELFKRNEK